MKYLRLIIISLPIIFTACFSLTIDREIEVDEKEDWLFIGGDLAKSNISKSESKLNPPYTLNWDFDADGGFSKSCLSVSDAVLFAATLNAELFAIDVLSGKSLGRVGTQGDASFSTPLIYKNSIVLTSSGGSNSRIFRYSLLSGKHLWKKNVGWIESSPVLDSSDIFVSTVSGKLVKINVITGNVIWYRKSSGRKTSGNSFYTSPTIGFNKVFLGGNDHCMYAFDCNTGKELWKFKTGGSIFCDASVNEGKIFFGSDDMNFYCLDTMGNVVWKNELNTKFLSSSTFFDSTVITAGVDGFVYCMNKSDGVVKWKFQTLGAISASPMLQNNKIFIGSYDRFFYCIDASDGRELWKFETEGRIKTGAVIWKDFIFFAGEDKYIYCLSDKERIKTNAKK